MKHILSTLFLSLLLFTGNTTTAKTSSKTFLLISPDTRLKSEIAINERISFTLSDEQQTILAPSFMAIRLQNGETWGTTPQLQHARRNRIDETIHSPFYKREKVQNRYNELILSFKGGYSLIFRMYDDGLAYRFATDRKGEIIIESETAEYCLSEDRDMIVPYVLPSGKAKKAKNPTFEQQFFNSMQNLYSYGKAMQLNPDRMMFTPVIAKLDDGMKLCIAEADTESYPGMYLVSSSDRPVLHGMFAAYPRKEERGGHNQLQMLVKSRESYIARGIGPRSFPWRTFIVTRKDGELSESDMVYRLASPSRVENIDWIKPGKVAWEWWNYWGLYNVDFRAGINTETYKYYIDFASKNNIEYVILDEGWSVKYAGDLLKVIPEIDLPELLRYAKGRNVGIILWAGYHAIERDMEHVVKHYAAMGVKGFKVDFLDRDDQKMIDFKNRLADICAQHHMLLDYHGCCKPSGLQRTYPNVLNYEAVFGLEQMKWTSSKTDMVTYDVTLPFIRMVAGPMDYTQGAMRNSIKGAFHADYKHPMSQGTRCRQLAEYVIFDSPLTMLCDSPSNYMREVECIRFIASVPTVWNDTKVLDGQIGEYIAVARRSGEEWFIGAMTNWSSRELSLEIPIADTNNYEIELFQDGINADRAAQDYKRRVIPLPTNRRLKISLAPGGGWAARIYPTPATMNDR